MNALVIGDPHFKKCNVEKSSEMVEKIINLVKEQKFDFCVILGDTLHYHEQTNYQPFKRAIDFLHRLSTLIKTFLLIGNHDLCDNQQFLTDNHFFNACKFWGERLAVVDTVTKWNNYLFVPYVPEGMFGEATSGKLDDIKLIFAHQQFKGSVNEMGGEMDGDVWTHNIPVISGHVHVHQKMGNILYVGSPIQHADHDRSVKTISVIKGFDIESEETINLGISRTMNMAIEYNMIDSVDLPKDFKVRLSIRGTNEQNASAKNHKKIIQWIKDGHVIHYKAVLEKIKKKKKAVRDATYNELVQEQLTTEELKKLYNIISS